MLLFIQLYAILFCLAIGNASLMLLINLLTVIINIDTCNGTRGWHHQVNTKPL